MFSYVTKLIRWFLSLFRIEIYRLPREYEDNTSFSLTAGEEFYTSDSWKDYLEKHGGYEYYAALQILLKEKGIDCDNKHIVDIGCGTGHLLQSISNNYKVASLAGTDISPAALEIARSVVPEADLTVCDLMSSNTRRNYDIVFCTEVLEHLVNPRLAMQNLLAMMRTPGIAIVTVPNGRIDTFRGHINFWSPESWDIFVRDTCKGNNQEYNIETGKWLRYRKNFAIIKLMEKS